MDEYVNRTELPACPLSLSQWIALGKQESSVLGFWWALATLDLHGYIYIYAGNITLDATAWSPEDSVSLADGRNVTITTYGRRASQSSNLPCGVPSSAATYNFNA